MKNKMLLDDGSIQNIPEIPDRIKAIYKNSWDLSNKTLIKIRTIDRGPWNIKKSIIKFKYFETLKLF